MDFPIQFESSPIWLLLAVPVILLLVWFHYNWKAPWSKTANILLVGLRALVLTLIVLILLNPLLKKNLDFTRIPVTVIAIDDSESMISSKNPIDEDGFNQWIESQLSTYNQEEKKIEIKLLSGREWPLRENESLFSAPLTNLDKFLHNIEGSHSPSELSDVILLSDGIFNSGLSPDFDQYPFPLHTVGTGDTSQLNDLAISFVDFNRISYSKSKFPINVEFRARGFAGKKAELRLLDENGEILERRELTFSKSNEYAEELFYLSEDSSGFKSYSVRLYSSSEELNKINNGQQIQIEIVDNKKKILLAGLSPHPDLAAIRSSLNKLDGIDIQIWLPEKEMDLNQEWDAVILHQIPNLRGKGNEVYKKLTEKKIPGFFIWGRQQGLNKIRNDFPGLISGRIENQYDEIEAYLADDFSAFSFDEELSQRIEKLPPQAALFGDYSTGPGSVPIILQRVGSTKTQRPLLLINKQKDQKIAFFTGNGLWSWKLIEYEQFRSSAFTEQMIQNTVQFLMRDEKEDRFSFDLAERDLIESNPVKFKTESYNEILEKTWGNEINLKVVQNGSLIQDLNFTNLRGKSKFSAPGLAQGVYSFTAETELGGTKFFDRGTFRVAGSQLEKSELTANHQVLKNLANRNSGMFFDNFQDKELDAIINKTYPKIKVKRSSTQPAIKIEWLFLILAVWLTLEWFFRKRLGAY